MDYFRFTLTETTDVAIESAGWVHTRAQLLREDETEIAAAQNGYVTRPRHEDSNFQGFMMRHTLDAGSYFLKVSSVPEVIFGFLDPVSPTGAYFLLIEEPVDPGSSRATATPLALRHTVAGRISSASDEDYYSLTVDKETYVTITAVPYGTSFPLVPTFFDADGTDLNAYVIRREEYGYEGRREAFAIVTQVAAGTYYVRVKAPDGGTGGPYVLSAWDTDYGQAPVKRCTDFATPQSDLLYGCQWHLKNTRQLGVGASEDINVEGVWETNKGEGINVAVVDTMVQPNHEDLVGTPDDPLDPDDDKLGRFDTARSHDYYDRGLETFEPHGTTVAGLIAARANDIGVRGVAPEATIYSFNLLAQHATDAQRADAFTRHMDVTAISNHSYGAVNGGTPSTVPGVWRMALERAVTDGYDGKGVFVTWAAGNDGDYGGWASLDERTTSYAVTAVCAIDIKDRRPVWSNRGPNLWICAPGHDLTSTRTANRYTTKFAGTSGSTPIVAGVAALVRAANPALTWRDVKLILANSARTNHPSHTRLPGALKYGSTSERYSFSYDYGFGAVDAGAAVALAKNWTDLPSLRKLEVSSGPLNIAIPDATHDSNFNNIVGKEISTSLKADSNFIEFIEFIELEVSITHGQARNLFIRLDSPSTTTSEITVPYFGEGKGRNIFEVLLGINWAARLADMVNPFTFGTARHLGEGAAGEWTLRIRDDDAVIAGTLHSWKLTFYGHGYKPGFPTLRTRDNRERIRINFDPPEDTGATPITSYDLRYIRANVPDKSDESLWTVVTGFPDPNNVGHNYLRGLLPGRKYDLQIRAVNATGAGPWSAASRAGQLPEPPRAPAIGEIVPRDRGLGVTWSAPAENGGTFINSYDLRANAGNWREFRNVWRSGDGDLTARISGLTNDDPHDVQVRARNGIGEGPWSTAVVTGTPAVQNQAPSFPPAETGTRAILEGPEGRNVGAPVSAVDPDTGESLTYYLSSGDEFFRIDSNTGQLLTRKALDRETTSSHALIVDVSDSKNSSGDPDAVVDDFIEVTVTVEDVNEAPLIDGEEAHTIEENSLEPVGGYTKADPEGRATSWLSLMGADGGHFELDEFGELSFAEPPDFEARTNNVYNVIVRASDDGTPPLIGELAVTVTVTPVDEPPVITGDAAHTIEENSLERVGRYTKADPEGRATSWLSLMGADGGHFELNEFGELSFAAPPDFEARTNNVYNVIVRASDDGTPPLIGELAVTVTVTPVDEPPVITGEAAHTIEENSLERVGRYTKADPEGRATSWLSLMGADGGHFELNEFGELSFAEPPDFEARTNNVYNVIVRASDDGTPPLIGELAVTVTVTPVDEPPVITGDAAPSIEEGGTLLVGTYRATDPEDATIAWQPLDGADKGKFDFTPSNGRLAFKVAPDFEDADRGGDNEYSVTLGVSAGGDATPFDVEVTVTNKEEPGTLELSTTQPQADAGYTATLGDPDGVQSTTWTWERSTSGSDPWSAVSGAFDRTTTSVYTPDTDDVGYFLRVTAAYTDGHGPNKSRVRVSANTVKAAPVTNDPPSFDEPTPTRSIAENAGANARVGDPVTATDPDAGDVITYELSGSDLFTIDSNSGLIRVKTRESLDYDDPAKRTQTVTVKASDSSNASATVQVTIEVTDVNEPPDAVADAPRSFDEDTEITIEVLDNDSDPEQERSELLLTVFNSGPNAPRNGTVTVNEPANVGENRTITYDPKLNYHGADTFTYQVRDTGSPPLSSTASVSVEVDAVNDAPAFPPSETGARSVSESAEAADNVGAPVTATDIDNAMLTYRLSGADASSFDIDSDGQITVGMGVTFNAGARDTYTVTVTAVDRQGETAMVEVTITVTAGPVLPPVIIITGGGGGGGGGGGPTPSEVDFEWTVDRDIEELDGGNDRATGVWSDGTTLWVADNADGAGDAVYAYDRASGERLSEREFALAETNRAPRGFWSDRSVVWVSDSGQERLFAYDLATGERVEEREFALAARNSDARGIWSDEETMWVLDSRAGALFAYGFESGELLAEYELDAANDDPRGIWSDGVTIWVSDHGAKRLIAYRLPAPEGPAAEDAEPQDLERVRDEEFPNTVLSRAGNNSPRGIWSDGDVMYVADQSDDRVYSYNMPDAIDARLASLTLSGVDIGEFDPGRPDYEAVVADGVTATTVEAEAMQRRTDIAIDPPDADGEVDGHQVALQDLGEITVTVTSQDGSRERVYRVLLGPEEAARPAEEAAGPAPEEAAGPAPQCLRGAVAVGFSLVVYEGGSVAELVGCAESRGIVALYALHEGVYVSHILGAPGFVNAGFLELFPDGLPPITPLIVGSNGPPSADPFGDGLEGDGQQPWPECLRGAVAAGFSLVVYEGGSVDELEACARSADITALYALSEGEFVSYILGAPDFVTQPFRDLFADGVPLMAPLVVKSEGLP